MLVVHAYDFTCRIIDAAEYAEQACSLALPVHDLCICEHEANPFDMLNCPRHECEAACTLHALRLRTKFRLSKFQRESNNHGIAPILFPHYKDEVSVHSHDVPSIPFTAYPRPMHSSQEAH